jgi:molybdenum cofactor synthesis domain-containing protein
MSETVTAAVLLIGDEILSGRTQDSNLQTIAKVLGPAGVQVMESRIIADRPEAIVAALNALRGAYDYVLTTGGIGPTHDDKTADAVAEAFGVSIDIRADARAILEGHYGGAQFLNEARLRMARIPEGARLIANPVSKAPGFQLGNVFVMAGVPSVMRGMLEDVVPHMRGGAVVKSVTVRGKGMRESELAAPLAALEREMVGLSFGSYPFFGADGFGASVVVRGTDPAALDAATERLIAMARALGVEPVVEQQD